MNRSPRANSVMDFISIAFALFSWILPDIPVLSKIIISAILVGVVIVVRLNPRLNINISTSRHVMLLGLPVVVGIVEFGATMWATSTFFPDLLPSPQSGLFEGMQFGFVYGLTVGFPIASLSYRWKVLDQSGDGCATSSAIGCGIQAGALMVIIGAAFLIQGSSSHVLDSVFTVLFFGFGGPGLIWASALHIPISGFWWLAYLVIFLLQNAQFELIGGMLAE